MILGHGDDGYLYAQDIKLNFSSNVWHRGLSAGLKDHLADALSGVSSYPDAGATRLQGMLEQVHQLDPGEVLVTNGATEAIYLIAQAFSGKRTTIVAPTFAEYFDACTLYRHDVQRLQWDKLEKDTRFPTDLVFLCNPNNPTGHALDEDFLIHLISNNRQVTFVIDEAYIQFCRDTTSLMTHLHRYQHVLVLRSLTKTCCIPGLRLGYVAGYKNLLQKIRPYRMPWSVNSLALEAGYYILSHPDMFKIPVDSLLADTYQLWNDIKAMPEFKVYPTRTHYFLFESLSGTAAALKAWLVSTQGILLRDASNFYGLGAGYCRVAARSAEDNRLLTQALRKWTLT